MTATIPPVQRRSIFLRRLALLCGVLVLAVSAFSAFLRLDKAGLGCSDWPACYGQAQRSAQRGEPPPPHEQTVAAVVRLGHRISASLALLLAVTLVMVCFGSRPWLAREGRLALVLLGLALALALLGVWSRDARVPAVAIGNLLGGFAMLALCVRLARPPAPPDARLRRWAAVAAVVLLLQIGLGALVSASFAGLACSGAADCSLAATWQAAGAQALDPWHEPVLLDAPPFNPAGAFALALHRHAAVAVLALLLAVALLALRRGRRRAGGLLLGLLGAQAALGLALGAFALPLPVALLHNLVAAALLGTLAALG